MPFIAFINTPGPAVARALEEWRAQAFNSGAQAWGVAGFHADRAVYYSRQMLSAAADLDSTERLEKADVPIVGACLWPLHLKPIAGPGDVQPFLSGEWLFMSEDFESIRASFPVRDFTPQGITVAENFFLWVLEAVRHAADARSALDRRLEEARRLSRVDVPSFVLAEARALWIYSNATHPLFWKEAHGGVQVSSIFPPASVEAWHACSAGAVTRWELRK